jgi:hypothetical protein
MSAEPAKPDPVQAARTMRVMGIVILLCVATFFLFIGVDGYFLADETADAVVLSLEYSEGGKTYVTQIINNRPYVMEQAKPEAFLVRVNLGGQEVVGAIEHRVFQTLEPGDPVEVVYQRRRLTGMYQVVSLRKL